MAPRSKKTLKRILFLAPVVIALAAIAGYFKVSSDLRGSVARNRGELVLEGLKERVTVRRDSLGVPYIEAGNEEDLFFTAGYVQASERLWQMVTMKMAMAGRLSELGGEKMLGVDIFMRSLGMGEFVRKQLPGLDRRVQRLLQSHADGVNAYLDTQQHLPLEFLLTGHTPERWSPQSSGYIFAMLTFQLAFNYLEELTFLMAADKVGYDKAAYLFPIYPDEPLPHDEAGKLRSVPHQDLSATLAGWPEIRKGLEGFIHAVPASNNWAVAPGRTRSGKSMVANDTHIPILVPSIWMLMHLKCPTYEAAGALVPGTPFIDLGYNRHLAWGITMVMADHEDIFVEKLKKKDGRLHYLYKGKWLPTEVRKETFSVQWGNTVELDIHSTVHGPLLNTALERMPEEAAIPQQAMPLRSELGLALSVAFSEEGDSGLGFYSLGKARTMAEARQAMSFISDMHLNVTYGDRDNIGWQVTGYYPVRKKGKGLLPSPGWTGEYDWQGALSFENHPHAENPPEGFLATANNRTVPRDFPHRLSSSWEKPERAQRLRQVLSAKTEATFEDMLELQNDRHSLRARKVQDLFFKGPMAVKLKEAIDACKNEKDREDAREALGMLAPDRFDAVMSVDSAPAAVLGAFVHVFTHETFADELGPEEGMLWHSFIDVCASGYSALQDHLHQRDNSPFWDNVLTKGEESKAEILALSLARAVQFCEKRMGSDRGKWQWGRLHTYTWRHDITRQVPWLFDGLNRGPFPAGGDSSTPDVSGFYWGKDLDVFLIPILRMIVDFGKEEPFYMLTVPGQSGNPHSPHYDDMIPLFLKGELHPMPFGAEAVRKQYRDLLVLKPR